MNRDIVTWCDDDDDDDNNNNNNNNGINVAKKRPMTSKHYK
jgi:hypothetical protein